MQRTECKEINIFEHSFQELSAEHDAQPDIVLVDNIMIHQVKISYMFHISIFSILYF